MEVGWLTISLLEAAIVLSDLSIVIPEEARIRQPCKADRGGVKAINPLPGGAEAEGQAAAILSVAIATAEGIRKVAESIQAPGGYQAVQLRVAEQYIYQFGNLAKESNTLVLPATLSDVGSMIALAMNVIRQGTGAESMPPPPKSPAAYS